MEYFSPMVSNPKLVINPGALRTKRLAAFLTQDELAQLSGVDKSTIRAAEAQPPKSVFPSTVKKLAAALNCGPGEISEVTAEVAS